MVSWSIVNRDQAGTQLGRINVFDWLAELDCLDPTEKSAIERQKVGFAKEGA